MQSLSSNLALQLLLLVASGHYLFCLALGARKNCALECGPKSTLAACCDCMRCNGDMRFGKRAMKLLLAAEPEPEPEPDQAEVVVPEEVLPPEEAIPGLQNPEYADKAVENWDQSDQFSSTEEDRKRRKKRGNFYTFHLLDDLRLRGKLRFRSRLTSTNHDLAARREA